MLEMIGLIIAATIAYFWGRHHGQQVQRSVQVENYTLRDALRNANAELYKHRRLIQSLRDGDDHVTEAIMAAMKKEKA
jgi:hypothetical protein